MLGVLRAASLTAKLGAIGIVLNYIGYFAWEFATPKWSLSDAIAKGSTAAGKVMFGMAIAIGLIISGSMS